MLNTKSNEFTKAQMSAINHFQGPCLVLAGPGSGKTKVITHRVAHLIKEQKISPEHILTITFTKAAALEMKERFLLLQPNTNTTFSTFHSCFYHILRNSHISYPQNFISREQKQTILKSISNSILQSYDDSFIPEIEKMIGIYINHMFQTKSLPLNVEISHKQLEFMFHEYQKALKKNHLTDYDMLLVDTYNLLNQNNEIRMHWQKQFQYILIDECQDMNLLQYEIIKLLCGQDRNVFMVGDDDQSIYRFRGSDISLMKRFLEEYEPVKQIFIDTNFRSSERIVNDSQKIICENKNRFNKNIVSFSKIKTGVEIKTFIYREEMYNYIVECLQNAPEDILDESAIICRTNAEVRFWGHIMRKNKIPYEAKEELSSIFDVSWFLDIEAYMKLAIAKYKTDDILRIANKPNRNMYRDEIVDISKIPKPISEEIDRLNGLKPFLALKYIWNGIGYGKWLEHKLINVPNAYAEALELLKSFQEESKKFNALEEWLMYIDEDRLAYKMKNAKQNSTVQKGVHLLTMHGSKGLEFENVYLPDVNKGKLPRGFLLDTETIEEERRLFYVAMTRAKSKLEIFYIKGTEGHKLEPSEFLEPLLK